MPRFLSFQPFLRPQLRTVLGNVDYVRFEQTLRRIDEILIRSGVEDFFIQQCNLSISPEQQAQVKWFDRYQQHSLQALRCMILKELTMLSVRELSCRLAESELFRWFCRVPDTGMVIRVPAKTTLNDYERRLDDPTMRVVINELLLAAMAVDAEGNAPWNLKNNIIELETVFLDSTAVKCNIHFPVDWVLLRDAVRTLMKATKLIRNHGLKHRMEPPESFLKAMNRLCIVMSNSRRRKDSKKERKRILRLMKQLTHTVRRHAVRHRDLLEQCWHETDWSLAQAQQVIGRMDSIVEQLPRAIKQAHERIIGERIPESKDKILSLYEPECRVIVRGKAGAEVEFGNTLVFAEQQQGLIIDWKLYQESAPADSRMLKTSLERILELGPVKTVVADRGFDSKANRRMCEELGIENGVCPRGPKELTDRMKEPRFAGHQTRRAQTEGRLAILKNCFLGRPLRAKGIENRQRAVCWAVLAHNLWVLARMPVRKVEPDLVLAA